MLFAFCASCILLCAVCRFAPVFLCNSRGTLQCLRAFGSSVVREAFLAASHPRRGCRIRLPQERSTHAPCLELLASGCSASFVESLFACLFSFFLPHLHLKSHLLSCNKASNGAPFPVAEPPHPPYELRCAECFGPHAQATTPRARPTRQCRSLAGLLVVRELMSEKNGRSKEQIHGPLGVVVHLSGFSEYVNSVYFVAGTGGALKEATQLSRAPT